MAAIGEFFSSFLDKVFNFLKTVLPTSPFRQYLQGYENGHSGLLAAVNYFVPIGTFIAILEAWVFVMFIYYLYHGLISKIWNANNQSNLKTKLSIITKLFGKL